MNKLLIYKIISYILLPVGAVLGLATLFALFYALGNIAMLFSVFLTGACVIYIFSSFQFLQKGIEKQQILKQSFKDIIKVNAYVALFFSILGLMQGFLILFNPDAKKLLLDNMMAMQAVNPQPVDMAMLQKVMKTVLYCMIFLSMLLVAHITSTLRLIRQHQYLFVKH